MLGRSCSNFFTLGFSFFCLSSAVIADECSETDDSVAGVLRAAEHELLRYSEYHIRTTKDPEKSYAVYLVGENSNDRPKTLSEALNRGAEVFENQKEARAFARSGNKEMRESGYAIGEEWRVVVVKNDFASVRTRYVDAGPAQREALQRLEDTIVRAAGNHGLGSSIRKTGITDLHLRTVDVSNLGKAERAKIKSSLMPRRDASTFTLTGVIGDSRMAKEVDYNNYVVLKYIKETDEFFSRMVDKKQNSTYVMGSARNFSDVRTLEYVADSLAAINKYLVENPSLAGSLDGYHNLSISTHNRSMGPSSVYTEGDVMFLSIGVDTNRSSEDVARETLQAFKARHNKEMTPLQKALK